MSDYIVSARKYRPASFDTVVGQGPIASTLKNAISSGKLAHAYLFCGPRGVGKTTCARIFAKTINCLNPRPDGEACNECESCQAFNEQRSLNIHELDAASNNSVDDIRALIDQVRIPPQIGKYKVFIIDEVHMLSASAFNAFLKTLEEPPAHAIFILATTEKHKILPTILSRCQIYDFQRMSVENIVKHLAHVAEQEGYTYEPAALNVIAQKADGGMRDALSIFDQVVSYSGGNITYQRVIENLNVLDYDYYFRLVDFMLEQKIPDCLLLFNEVLSKGFEGGPFVSGLASHLRDVLVSRDPQTTQLLEVSDDIRRRYAEQAQRCKPQWLYRAISLCNQCDLAYRTSRNKRLQVELMLIECAQAVSDDEASAGRRPVRKLKPIFSLQTVAVQEAQRVPKAPSTPHPSARPLVASTLRRTLHPQPLTLNSKPSTQKGSPLPPLTSGAPKLKSINLSTLAPSIRRPSAGSQPSSQKPPLSSLNPKPSTLNQEEDRPVTQEQLLVTWQEFINTMPQDETALAQRMRIMQPQLADGTNVAVTVENQEVLAMMNAIKSRIDTFLRAKLHNSQLALVVNVSTQKAEQPFVYDKREQLRRMCSQNPALITLGKTFKLELS